MGPVALAAYEFATQLGFERLDCTRKRWLCNIATLSRLGQIQGLADRQKIADLMHFHLVFRQSFELRCVDLGEGCADSGVNAIPPVEATRDGPSNVAVQEFAIAAGELLDCHIGRSI